MIFINYTTDYIISKRDALLAIHNFGELKNLANNAKIRSSLKFLLYCIMYIHVYKMYMGFFNIRHTHIFLNLDIFYWHHMNCDISFDKFIRSNLSFTLNLSFCFCFFYLFISKRLLWQRTVSVALSELRNESYNYIF